MFVQDMVSATLVIAPDDHELDLRRSLKDKSSFSFKPSLHVMQVGIHCR